MGHYHVCGYRPQCTRRVQSDGGDLSIRKYCQNGRTFGIVYYGSFHVNAGPDVGTGKKTTGVPVVLLPERSLKLSISNVTFKL